MATKREQILAALKTSLTGTVGAGTRIYRSRVEPFVRGESIAVVLEPVSDTPTDQTIHTKTVSYTHLTLPTKRIV